jgi:ribose transport system substrate-binding protein
MSRLISSPVGRGLVACSAAASLALVLASCATSGPAPSEDDSDSGAMAQAQEAVDAAKAPIAADSEVAEIDTSSLAGKTVYVLQADASNGFVTTISDALEEANDLVGVDTVVFDGQQNAANYDSLINQAISQKADAIVLINVGVEVPSAIAAAKAAGIPLIVSGVSSASDWQFDGTAAAEVAVDTMAVGRIQSDLAYTLSDGNVHAIGYGAQEFPQDVAQMKGQEAELQDLCAETCTHLTRTVQLTSYQGDTPGNVRADLLANPDANWLMPAWDFLATYANAGLRLANNPDVQISSWNGIPVALEMVNNGELAGTIGVPLRQWGWQLADSTYRVMADGDVASVAIPTRLLTADVLEGLSAEPTEAEIYGNESVFSQFQTAWGVAG